MLYSPRVILAKLPCTRCECNNNDNNRYTLSVYSRLTSIVVYLSFCGLRKRMNYGRFCVYNNMFAIIPVCEISINNFIVNVPYKMVSIFFLRQTFYAFI